MKKITVLSIAAACVAGVATAQNLTEAQASELIKVSQGFTQQATVFEGLMQNKITELAIELQREGRLDTKESAAEASKRTNVLLTDLGNLYGEFIKAKVQYVVKAKNVLTDEQKIVLLSQLKPSDSLPYETIAFLQPEAFHLPLNLSLAQEKKLLKIQFDMMGKEIEIERDVELALLDLRELLLKGEPNAAKADPLVMKLAHLAAQSIDNRVQFFIQSKDVLTLDQKRLLANMLGLD